LVFTPKNNFLKNNLRNKFGKKFFRNNERNYFLEINLEKKILEIMRGIIFEK
jgi:hypothetical protein